MNIRNSQCLTVLLCAAIFTVSACTATTPIIVKPSQESLRVHDIGEGEIIRLHWANTDTPRRSSVREEIYIVDLTKTGVRTLSSHGRVVEIAYDEIAQIEYRQPRVRQSSDFGESLLWLLYALGHL